MSITDELREFASHCAGGMGGDSLRHIADRIDAEHEAKVSYWQGASYKDGYDEGFASADDWLADHEDAMAEHGWVKLPVDADGEVIHAEDELFWKEDGDSVGRVTAIGVGQRAGWVWTLPDGHNVSIGREACRLRHHHEPTVEDVLFEFARFWCDEELTDIEHLQPDAAQTIAEFAAKLRLAKEGE